MTCRVGRCVYGCIHGCVKRRNEMADARGLRRSVKVRSAVRTAAGSDGA